MNGRFSWKTWLTVGLSLWIYQAVTGEAAHVNRNVKSLTVAHVQSSSHSAQVSQVSLSLSFFWKTDILPCFSSYNFKSTFQ